jgi:hypothetical protein
VIIDHFTSNNLPKCPFVVAAGKGMEQRSISPQHRHQLSRDNDSKIQSKFTGNAREILYNEKTMGHHFISSVAIRLGRILRSRLRLWASRGSRSSLASARLCCLFRWSFHLALIFRVCHRSFASRPHLCRLCWSLFLRVGYGLLGNRVVLVIRIERVVSLCGGTVLAYDRSLFLCRFRPISCRVFPGLFVVCRSKILVLVKYLVIYVLLVLTVTSCSVKRLPVPPFPFQT